MGWPGQYSTYYSLGYVEAAEELGNVLVAALPGQSSGPYDAVTVDFVVYGAVEENGENP